MPNLYISNLSNLISEKPSYQDIGFCIVTSGITNCLYLSPALKGFNYPIRHYEGLQKIPESLAGDPERYN